MNCFDVKDQYVRKVNIGKFAICEIPNNDLANKITECKDGVYLITKYKQKLLLKYKKQYTIEAERKIIKVWFCKIIENDQDQNKEKDNIECIQIIYARCEPSMIKLDRVHRKFVLKFKFNNNEIMAIKSVAGSGKTTTLLDLAKKQKNKRT